MRNFKNEKIYFYNTKKFLSQTLRMGWDSVRHKFLLKFRTTLPRLVGLRLSHPPHISQRDYARRHNLSPCVSLRMGWDSNPRFFLRNGGLVNRCLKPLGHPSIPPNIQQSRFFTNTSHGKYIEICYTNHVSFGDVSEWSNVPLC